MSEVLHESRNSDGIREVAFRCPGCKEAHIVRVAGPSTWQWNGDLLRPTFTPSILIRSGHYAGKSMDECWCAYNAQHKDDPTQFTCGVCHSYVKDGSIQFLADCTHALAGRTVPLQPWNGDAV